jgi:hypothetical protein
MLIDVLHPAVKENRWRVLWGLTAIVSAYAVVAPEEVLALNPMLWSMMLFVSIISFPSKMAASPACRVVWSTVFLGLSIAYIAVCRQSPETIYDHKFQSTFTLVIGCAVLFSVMNRLCVWTDSRSKRF